MLLVQEAVYFIFLKFIQKSHLKFWPHTTSLFLALSSHLRRILSIVFPFDSSLISLSRYPISEINTLRHDKHPFLIQDRSIILVFLFHCSARYPLPILQYRRIDACYLQLFAILSVYLDIIIPDIMGYVMLLQGIELQRLKIHQTYIPYP